jgi:hypothetical protein
MHEIKSVVPRFPVMCSCSRNHISVFLTLRGGRLVTVPSKVRNVFPDRSGRNFATRVDVGHSFLPGFRVRDGEVNGVPFSNVT